MTCMQVSLRVTMIMYWTALSTNYTDVNFIWLWYTISQCMLYTCSGVCALFLIFRQACLSCITCFAAFHQYYYINSILYILNSILYMLREHTGRGTLSNTGDLVIILTKGILNFYLPISALQRHKRSITSTTSFTPSASLMTSLVCYAAKSFLKISWRWLRG